MSHGGDDGMATDAELKDFAAAEGPAAQKMYLEMMTTHHEGAITMARTEVDDGGNPDAVQLAQDIIASQQQEITVMSDLLARL